MSKTLKQKIAYGVKCAGALAGVAAIGYIGYKAATDEGVRSAMKEMGEKALRPAMIGGVTLGVVGGAACALEAADNNASGMEIVKASWCGIGYGALAGASIGATISNADIVLDTFSMPNTVGG
jgi:hypothetical protein